MQNVLKAAAQQLVARTNKTFTFQDIIKYNKQTYKNLPELLGQYPNQGVGFKVWRKTWPSNKFIIVKEAQFKNLRNGKFFGIEYYKDKPLTSQPIKIRNGSKRGVWRFDVNGVSAMTENGLYYSAELMDSYREQHVNKQRE